MHLSQGNTTLSFGIIVIALITALVLQFTMKIRGKHRDYDTVGC